MVSTQYFDKDREEASRGLRGREQDWFNDVLHTTLCTTFCEDQEGYEEEEVRTMQSASPTTRSIGRAHGYWYQ